MTLLMKLAHYSVLDNERQRIPKGQSKMDNPEKLATSGGRKTQHNMCWIPLYANKHSFTEKIY